MLLPGPLKGRGKPSIAVPKIPDFPLTSEGVCEMFMAISRDKDATLKELAEENGRLKARIEQLERELEQVRDFPPVELDANITESVSQTALQST